MLRWGVTSVRLMAEDVATAVAAGGRVAHPRPTSRTSFRRRRSSPSAGGWWVAGRAAGREPRPFSRRRPRRRATRCEGEGARLRRDQADARRHGLVPRPAAASRGCARTSPPRSSTRRAPGAARVGPRPGARQRERGGRRRRHGARARSPRAARREDDRGHEDPGPSSTSRRWTSSSFSRTRARFVDSVSRRSGRVRPGGLPRETLARYRSAEYSDGYRRALFRRSRTSEASLPALYANLRTLPRGGRARRARHGHVGLPGARRVDRDGPLRPRRTALPSRRSAPRPRRRPARSGSMPDRGTLESGKRADFLVLAADPLADVKNVRRIQDVYKNGRRAGAAAETPK